MKCPRCGFVDSKVNDSRLTKDQSGVRRRRECLECGHRFTTFERIDSELPLIHKRDDRRERFDQEKILRGVRIACEKRPVSISRIEKLVERIETNLAERTEKEISSKELGSLVMAELRELDQVAYVRFASVYREFQDVEEFLTVISGVLKPGQRRKIIDNE